MATLADIKRYFESGRYGRPLPLSQLRELSPEDRDDLTTAIDELDGEVFDAEDTAA